MNCVSYCLIATALLVSNIVIMITCKYNQSFKDFNNSLNKSQLSIYNKIINERLSVYIHGIILGLLLGVLFVIVMNKLKRYNRICLFVLVVLLTSMVYYKLMPKSDYMIKHLTSPNQIDKWLKIYTTIKFRGTISILISIIAYILLGFACC